ncbi:C-5 cytosine-specific DNA methylase [Solimicrobium silvestre]|uniref:DNA (cytosine-5-)-methyltransferase n=2 Tax=Solimicrobium silvestre TaxID=2099400 RepID=A0A2S9GY53_9BURK|nr:DNA cytosine methyltransferase [Solimicrobium silvestre]PRC92652.1 C-5 cytosine-specific DNA methylase [Solimicrobium silvestre]
MRYGSVCSGIEAASVAWHPLGWSAAWLAEIESFPCSVLKHHYPVVENLGDMTQIAHLVRDGFVEAPDVLVGGTPCQAFSIAGLRNSLDDMRGQLTLSFVDLANAIDTTRLLRGEQESIIVWENVPGVLSTKDNAFGCFLAALAGEDETFEVPRGGKWSKSGCVFGPQRTVAWRILDAQYFGVAQRRRRVFVIASARKDIDCTEILFEFDGVRRDIAPSRETGQEVAGTITSGAYSGGAGGRPEGAACGHFQPVVGTIGARTGLSIGAQDAACGHLLPVTTNRMVAFGEYVDDGTASTMKSRDYKDATDLITYGIPGNWIGRAPENGGNATEPMHNIAPCLTKTDQHAVCAPNLIGAFKGGQGAKAGGIGFDENVSPTLSAADSGSNRTPVIAFSADTTPTLTSNGDAHSGFRDENGLVAERSMQVRRLTPIECERLQGFPDNYTRIPERFYKTRRITKLRTPDRWEKADGGWLLMSADGPRYKSLGNSMAVPVMAWIGARIQMAVAA